MKIDLQDQENIRSLRNEIFPYYMDGGAFLRMINSLLETSRHNQKDVNEKCHQLVKDFTMNKDNEGNVTWEGWNTVLQQKLRAMKIDPHQSLLVHRYWEYDIQLSFNTIFLLSSGRYHLAAREMRFVLESFVHAFCIDKIYESFSLAKKIEELKDLERERNERFWRKDILFKKTFTKYTNTKNLGIEMHKFYQELCRKVHPSYEELSHLRDSIKVDGKKVTMGLLYNFYNKKSLFDSLDTFSRLHQYLIKILDSF
jgi:hypothetical protein